MEIEITQDRDVKRQLRKELASWQKAGIGMLILAVLSNMALLGIHSAERKQWQQNAMLLQSEIQIANDVRDQALQELGALACQTAKEQESRTAQAAAYAEIGSWQYIGECMLTAYCCEGYPHICGTGDGLTATGIPVSPGIAAVDPDVIPFGSTVVIDGQRYLAADTGAAVKGLHVDIAVPTHAEAEAFGVQAATVWIIPQESVGAP